MRVCTFAALGDLDYRALIDLGSDFRASACLFHKLAVLPDAQSGIVPIASS